MRPIALIVLSAAAVSAMAALLLAQDDAATLKVEVNLVNILFNVRDKKGGLVGNLNKDDFKVIEDGKEQEVKYFNRETDLPLTIGLLIDVSASQMNLIEIEKNAAYQFFGSVLRKQDLAFLISFGEESELLQDYTNSPKLLRAGLEGLHVSSGVGVALVESGRNAGIDVTCETCPHYLVLTEEDVIQLGAVAKCAPPLRPTAEREDLWRRVLAGEVDTIGSDHSPAPPDMKTDANFFKVWGGLSGVQHTLPLVLTEGHVNRRAALTLIARLTSTHVGRRFALPGAKRGIMPGADADLAIVDLKRSYTVRTEDLFYRHKQTPYAGRSLTGTVVETILRGETIFKDGRIASLPIGRLVKPQR